MNIRLKKADIERLKGLINIRNDNFKILQIYSEYLNNCPTLVKAELVREITEECSVSAETAFVSILSAACGHDTENNKSEREFEERYFIPSVKKLSAEKYKDNPYLKNINFPRVKESTWELTSLKYEPYEGFVRDDIILNEDFTEVPKIGFFEESHSFPAVLQDGREWMAVKPNEIETMRAPLERVKGRVLTLGLGLGYFTYCASEKEEVTSVTVIEKDETVINLFKKHILPQFKNRNKVKIISADAFSYVEGKLCDGEYDFLFADTWHDVSDGFDMYLRLKNSEKRFKRTEFLYWIEKSLLSHLRWLIFDSLAETVLLDGAQDGRGEEIRDFEGVKALLTDEKLKSLAGNIHKARL